jgi:predicted nucleotidyltransferase
LTSFTATGIPAAEARVAGDLALIVEAVRAEAAGDSLAAVFLLGGYARGEGAVRTAEDGTLRGFNDYDLLLVFSAPPRLPARFSELSRRLARELEIDFVDLGVATPRELAAAPPTLFWYELGEAHRLLWSQHGDPPPLRRFSLGDIDPAEGPRLLLNRGLALLWAGARLWSGPGPGSGSVTQGESELRFATIAAHKAVLAAGDAALLRANAYTPSQSVRQATLLSRPDLIRWAGDEFLDAYGRAVAFRRQPARVAPQDVAALWWEAREHHERGFRAAEESRLGAAIPDWATYRTMRRTRAGRRPTSARSVARTVWRMLRGGRAVDSDERWMREMTGLLYDAAAGGGNLPPQGSWKARSLALVGEWHS